MALPRPIFGCWDATGLRCPDTVSGDIFRTGDAQGLLSLLLCRSSDDIGRVARMGPLPLVGDCCCIMGDTCPAPDMPILSDHRVLCPSFGCCDRKLARQEQPPQRRDNPGVMMNGVAIVVRAKAAPRRPPVDAGARRPIKFRLEPSAAPRCQNRARNSRIARPTDGKFSHTHLPPDERGGQSKGAIRRPSHSAVDSPVARPAA
jgi:hypothetical protein